MTSEDWKIVFAGATAFAAISGVAGALWSYSRSRAKELRQQHLSAQGVLNARKIDIYARLQSAGAQLEATLGDPASFGRAYEDFTKLKHGELILVTSPEVLAAATFLWWSARGLRDRSDVSSTGVAASELQRRLFKMNEACRNDVRLSFQLQSTQPEEREMHRLLYGDEQ